MQKYGQLTMQAYLCIYKCVCTWGVEGVLTKTKHNTAQQQINPEVHKTSAKPIMGKRP